MEDNTGEQKGDFLHESKDCYGEELAAMLERQVIRRATYTDFYASGEHKDEEAIEENDNRDGIGRASLKRGRQENLEEHQDKKSPKGKAKPKAKAKAKGKAKAEAGRPRGKAKPKVPPKIARLYRERNKRFFRRKRWRCCNPSCFWCNCSRHENASR